MTVATLRLIDTLIPTSLNRMMVKQWSACYADEALEQHFGRIVTKLNKHTDAIESVSRSTDTMRSSLTSSESKSQPRKFTKENEFDYDSSFKKEDNRLFAVGSSSSVSPEQRKLFRDALSQFSLTESAIASCIVAISHCLLCRTLRKTSISLTNRSTRCSARRMINVDADEANYS